MLTSEQNNLLTRVGPGTPMGAMLREYWAPAIRSDALERDGAPKRVRMLAENFVAFRASDGRVGFLDEACPHRGASLALGRNEQNGLRCIFHGWKMDVDGSCVDTPCEPADRRAAFAAAVKVRRFPVHETGGIVWVYLGARAVPPRFPAFEFTTLPASQVDFRRGLVPYNWLQGLEAHIDSSHVGVLHSGFIKRGGQLRDLHLAMVDNAPVFEMDATSYGLREGALRDVGDGRLYVRIRQIALPYFTFIPANKGDICSARATVPVDDDWDAEWYFNYNPDHPITDEQRAQFWQNSSQDPDDFTANLGGPETNWHQDRDAMKNGHWSGLTRSIPFEDFTVQASMGPRVDRSAEQLGGADAIVVRTRRLLLDAVEAWQRGEPPAWQSDEVDHSRVRAVAATFPKGQDWRQFSPDLVDPTRAAAE